MWGLMHIVKSAKHQGFTGGGATVIVSNTYIHTKLDPQVHFLGHLLLPPLLSPSSPEFS